MDLGTQRAARRLLAELDRRGETLSAAESLTGGLVLASLTEIPGSSSVVSGGVVAYSDSVKIDQLGVDAHLLRVHGAVSGQVARQMAEGCRSRLGTTIAVATTGEAGPLAATSAPVGTFFVAAAGPGATVVREGFHGGDRAHVRSAAVHAAIEVVAELVLLLGGRPGGPGAGSGPGAGALGVTRGTPPDLVT